MSVLMCLNTLFLFYFSHPQVSNNTRQHRQNRGRMNGHTNSQGKAYSGTHTPQLQQCSQSAASSKESSTQQVYLFFPSFLVNLIPKMSHFYLHYQRKNQGEETYAYTQEHRAYRNCFKHIQTLNNASGKIKCLFSVQYLICSFNVKLFRQFNPLKLQLR